MRILALGALALLTGCATAVDIAHIVTVPRGTLAYGGPAVATERVDRWRDVVLEAPAGLVCTEARRPHVRRATTTVEADESTGYRLPTIVATTLDAAALAGIVAARESTCANDSCGSPWFFYPFLLPLVADMGWGLYRSLTIAPPVYHSMRTEWSTEPGDEAMVSRAPCPAGTTVALRARGTDARLSVHIGADGRLDPSELPALRAFVTAHHEIDSDRALSPEVRFDATARTDLLGRRADASAPARPRASIEWQADGPVVSGVTVDFPLEAVCAGDAACARGQRCRDRGDGVTLCMGSGMSHRFCALDRDCPAGLRCTPRASDAVGVCGP